MITNVICWVICRHGDVEPPRRGHRANRDPMRGDRRVDHTSPSLRERRPQAVHATSPGHSIPSVPTSPATSSSASPNPRGASRMLSPPPTAASSRRASKARTLRTIMDSWISAVCYACRPQGCLHLGRKYRLEIVTLVVRRSEAAGWRWSSSTMNEWKPSYLGVAVVPRTRPMAPELRGSCLARRQGSSSDVKSAQPVYETFDRGL